MDNHTTVGHQNLQQQLVPRTPVGPATPSPAYIVHQSQQVAPAAPSKRKTPAERWDLQDSSLYRIANVPRPEDLPEIWQNLASPTKEKERPAFNITCRESARALQCKAPRVTDAVSVLLLGIHFFTEDTDFVNDTVIIFQFPELFLSAGSEASMVTQIWDTALDTKTRTSYADAAALMKQQGITPIVGREAAENMLEQWFVVVTVLLGQQEHHLELFELATLLKAAEEVNSRLQAQAEVQQ